MKKLLFLILFPLAVFTISSCGKNTDPDITNAIQQSAIDDAAIKGYLSSHAELTNVKDTLGVYYQIMSEGTGPYPTDKSKLSFNYVGTFLNGTQFDASTNYINTLGNLIYGWRIVLPHVRVGSKVFMLVPSLYGYGAAGTSTIPGGSVLLFTVTTSVPGI